MGNVLGILRCGGELPNYSKDAKRYATIDEVWEWDYVECDGAALNKMRRQHVPDSYVSIVDLVTRVSGGTISAHAELGEENDKTLQSEDGAYRNATTSIIGNPNKNKAHQIPKAKPCRCYYGPIAECVAGLRPIPPDKREDGWNFLLSGLQGEIEEASGERKKMSLKGLEKLAENLLIMMKPHDGYYDTYDDGILLTLPITTFDDAVNWRQGDAVDLLVLADREGYSAPFETKAVPGLLTKAKPEEIEKATKFVGNIIAALTDLLSSGDSDYFLQTMNAILRRGIFFGEESERQTALTHLKKLNELRDALREPDKKGKAWVPTKVISKKPLMKVNMRVWMEASRCDRNLNGTDPYVDPLLAGVKAGNGLYFGKTGKKFLPGCKRENDGDDTDDDSEESAGVPLHLCTWKPGQGGAIQPPPSFYKTPRKSRPSEITTPPTRPLDDDELSDISAVL